MTVIIKTLEYLKLKLGKEFPPEILEAMAVSLRAGLEETIPFASYLRNFNKELPVEVFEDTGCLKIKTRDVILGRFVGIESYVDLTDVSVFEGHDRAIWR